jgi:hypothetical protein
MLSKYLNQSQKNSFYALVTLCLPPEIRHSDILNLSSYSFNFLHFLLNELDLQENYFDAYSFLVDTQIIQNEVDKEKKNKVAEPFLQVLQLQAIELNQPLLLPFVGLMITLILHQRYDATTRSMIRQLLGLILSKLYANESILPVSIIALEEHIIFYLESEFKRMMDHEAITHSQDPKQTQRRRYIRYAQVGAVSIVAGAAIALTGG